MFYVIAAQQPNNGSADAQQIMAHIGANTPLLNERNNDPRQVSGIHMYQIDKKQFKIGSLDLLMQLNESSARVDASLDGLVKKLEKIELDTRGDKEKGHLTYKVNYAGKGIPYTQYVREFKWDMLKYPTKRNMNELTLIIQKGTHQKEEQIRKNMDEFNLLKNRISAMVKKDTGSL